MTRPEILAAAEKCVCGDREQDYGTPEQNFLTIANLWIDYLTGKGQPVDISAVDVAAMLALLKIARIASGHAKADNWVDLAGYAACGGEIETATPATDKPDEFDCPAPNGVSCKKCPLSIANNRQGVTCDEYAKMIGIEKATKIRDEYLNKEEKE